MDDTNGNSQAADQILKEVDQNPVENIENPENIIQECATIVKKVSEQSVHNAVQTTLIDQYALEAHKLVDAVIKQSTENMEICSLDPQGDWLTIANFSIERGKNKIKDYIQTWKRSESWLYYIEFLCEDEFEFNKRYRYKVQWSIPTRRKPIARATASVYFTIKASTVKPKTSPCEVYYIFETSKLVHRPGFSTFREKWLKDIIDSKVLLMENITF